MTAWLLTWLWQGSALVAGVAVALRYTPRLNAASRHLIWFGALAGLVSLGLGSSSAFPGAMPASAAQVIYVPSAPDALISVIFGVWMSVALVRLVRVLPSLHALYSLRDRSVVFPPDIESRLPLWLETRDRGRRTELMICDALPGATVLGLQRPCIALPTSLVEALTPDELDQVILHEHAHVQRRDDWWRLAETLLVSVLWIHPAAFFISRALHREREMACDEWVVARTGAPKVYARCLTRAAEVRGRTRATSELAPALLDKRHELVRRVDRLLALKGNARRNVSVAAVAAAILAIAAAAAHIQALRFAEIAEAVLPSVARPIIAGYDAGLATLAPEFEWLQPRLVQLKPDTTYGGTLEPDTTRSVRLKPDTTYGGMLEPDTMYGGTQGRTSQKTYAGAYEETRSVDTLYVPVTSESVARVEPAAAPVTSAPVAPSTAFAAVYSARAPVEPASDLKGWSALGAPGVEIASAAKKTSVGVAGLFSRGGVSLARSF